MVYGKNLPQATMYPGVMDFLKACKDHGFQARIVSHKTQTNKFDLEQINLRKAAFAWLEGHRIFSDPAIGMETGTRIL